MLTRVVTSLFKAAVREAPSCAESLLVRSRCSLVMSRRENGSTFWNKKEVAAVEPAIDPQPSFPSGCCGSGCPHCPYFLIP